MTEPPHSPPRPAPSDTITALLQDAGLPLAHSPAALAEAAACAERPGLEDPALVDLLPVGFVTVDNDGSRDLDQALHVQAEASGWRVRYALADAAHYVRPGSALWSGALQRGASLYAPDRAVAMLPEALSEDLVSLNPGEARRSLVFDMQVDGTGLVERCEVYRALVRSRLQLTYDGVQAVVDGTASLEQARSTQSRARRDAIDEPLRRATLASLQALRDVGEALQDAQIRRGVMPFDRTESEIRVRGEPPRFDVEPRARLDSERWNEQLSLACNMQGARLLQALQADDPALQPVFRVHDAPGGARLRELEKTLQALTERLQLSGAWARMRNDASPLAVWFAALPDNAPRLKRAIQRQVLRAQNASDYESIAAPHHALAADAYARFSSPMREVVGIHTHLVLLTALAAQTDDAACDAATRDAVIASAQAARVRQKTLDRRVQFAVLSALFARDIDVHGRPVDSDCDPAWRDGTLLGLDTHKLHVALDGMALDVKVYRQDLDETTGTTWTFDGVAATPADGRSALVLGDGVRVRAVRFDRERERYALTLKPLGNRPSLSEKRRGALKRRARRRAAIRRRATRVRPA